MADCSHPGHESGEEKRGRTPRRRAEDARLAAVQKGIELERTVAAQQKRNVELYKLADEILTRYSKFGLGEAIAAREPFTGLARVKLQNIAQDYKDQLLDNVIQPNT